MLPQLTRRSSPSKSSCIHMLAFFCCVETNAVWPHKFAPRQPARRAAVVGPPGPPMTAVPASAPVHHFLPNRPPSRPERGLPPPARGASSSSGSSTTTSGCCMGNETGMGYFNLKCVDQSISTLQLRLAAAI